MYHPWKFRTEKFFIINDFGVPKVLLSKQAEPVVEGTIDELVDLGEGYYKFKQGELWGVVDNEGKVITKPEYIEINEFFDDRSLFVKNDANGEAKYGFINRSGKEVIPGKYFSASDFSEGWASVVLTQGSKAEFINCDGKVLLKPAYENVRPYGSGMIPFMNEPGKIGYTNDKDELVIDLKFEDGLSFIGEVAPVKMNGKWGLTDKSGNMKVEAKYDGIYKVPGDQLFITAINQKYGLINDQGEILFEPTYQAVVNSSVKKNPDDYVYTLLLDDKFGILDPKTGEIIIEPKFQDKIVYRNGYAIAQENGKFGIIDKQGQYVLEPKFSSIGEYNHGVLPVMIDLFEDEMIDSPLKPNQEDLTSTYGFINLDEEVVLSLGNENF